MRDQANTGTDLADLFNHVLMAWTIKDHNRQIVDTGATDISNLLQIVSDGGVNINYVFEGRGDGNFLHIEDAGRSCVHRAALSGCDDGKSARKAQREEFCALHRVNSNIHPR